MKKNIAILFALVSCTVFGQKLTKSITNGNWNTASTWSNGIPGYKDTAVINNSVTITSANTVAKITINAAGALTNRSTLNISHALANNGTFTDVSGAVDFTGGTGAISVSGASSTSFYNLTIDNSGGVNVSDTISVKNGLSLNRGTLKVSSGYLILQSDALYKGRVVNVGFGADISGKFRAEIWDNRCSSAPIASDLSMYSPPMPASLSSMGLLLASNAYTYDETQPGNKSSGYVTIPSSSTTINRGQGFFYYYSNFNGGPNFARKIPVIDSMSFSGAFAFPVSFTSSAGGALNDGWNLIGNPYPATIDWQSSGWFMNRVDYAIYTWNTCSNVYATYVAGVGLNGGSRYINEFQGFWVHANRPGPFLLATRSVITGNSSSLLREASFGDSIPMAVHITLGLDEIAVRLDSNATDGFDTAYDALKFFSDSSRLYSFVSGDTSIMYSVNTVKDSAHRVVPFSVYGSGTLSFTNVSSMKKYAVYLKDLYLGNTHRLYDGYQYSYRQSASNSVIYDNKRFQLVFRDTTILSVANPEKPQQTASFYPNPSTGELTLKCSEPGSVLSIYDALGRQMISQKLEQNETLLHLNLLRGIYFVRVQAEDKILLQDKLVISSN